jgi:hypothetical protein
LSNPSQRQNLCKSTGAPQSGHSWRNRAERGHYEANPVRARRGNKLAERHGFYSKVLAPAELDEVDEIATVLRDVSPLDIDALEPLVMRFAGQVWRRRRPTPTSE